MLGHIPAEGVDHWLDSGDDASWATNVVSSGAVAAIAAKRVFAVGAGVALDGRAPTPMAQRSCLARCFAVPRLDIIVI